MSLVIREAGIEDCGTILELIRDLAEYEKLADSAVATEADLQERLFGSTRYAQVRIAEMDGVPVGFALFFFNFSTFLGKPGLYLEDLFVKPEFRGAGVGKALFQELAKVAKASDCGRMEWMVLDWNEPAQGFYRRIGACQVDGWHVWRMTEAAISHLAI